MSMSHPIDSSHSQPRDLASAFTTLQHTSRLRRRIYSYSGFTDHATLADGISSELNTTPNLFDLNLQGTTAFTRPVLL